MELIGDAICSNKKSRGEKCVYLTSIEEINKSTYDCKQWEACSHVLDIPIKDQKPVLPSLDVLLSLDGTTALEKGQSWITRKRNSLL